MIATSDLMSESSQMARLEENLPSWRKIPLYRESLSRGDFDFKRLPLIAKREMRTGFPANFLPGNVSLDELVAENVVELEHTSGTSEERLPVIFARGWWDAQERKALDLNAYVRQELAASPHARRATLTSPSCNGLSCPTVWMSREQRTIGSTLFVNLARIPFLLSDADLGRMADEIAAWEPLFLDVAPSHAVRFAMYCEEHGRSFPSLRFIICSYEFSSVVHRRILARVFGVPVLNLYGSTETGHLLMENGQGELKPAYENAFLEIPHTDATGVGALVVTTLTNEFMPLLRYRIGDLAQKMQSPRGTHYLIHGRARDSVQTAQGKTVTTYQVDQAFTGVDGLAHYELRQAADGQVTLRYVPDRQPPSDADLKQVTARLEALLGTTITTEPMTTIVPTASGKFRLTARLV